MEQLEHRRILSASRLVDFGGPRELGAAAEEAPAFAAQGRAHFGLPAQTRDLSVLSWNLYLGADLTGVLSAVVGGGGLPALQAEVQQVVASVFATNFAERADALAEQIAAVEPDVIGLQEAVEWSIPVPGVGLVEIDFREILLAELADEGLSYKIVADTTETDISLFGIGFTDHDVILARTDSKLKISNVQEENFSTNLVIPLPPDLGGGSLTFLRGWNSVDVKFRGAEARVVNTHLEVAAFAPIQHAQAAELLASATATTLPVVLLGDFNSSADPGGPNDTMTYELLQLAGFQDAWSRTNPGEPGYTCCQEANLRSDSTLDDRIDLVLTRGVVLPVATDVLGEEAADRTKSGLWPSDHAGVSADLRISVAPSRAHDAVAALFDAALGFARHAKPADAPLAAAPSNPTAMNQLASGHNHRNPREAPDRAARLTGRVDLHALDDDLLELMAAGEIRA